jgi:hypothetical protein
MNVLAEMRIIFNLELLFVLQLEGATYQPHTGTHWTSHSKHFFNAII